MTIDFQCLGGAIGRIGMVGKAARVDRPAICFGLAFGNPFRGQLARPACLNNAKGKGTGLKGIWYARHGPDKRKPVRGIRNRAIYHPCNTATA